VLLICGLLALSGAMLYLSATPPGTLFGYAAVLVESRGTASLCTVEREPAQTVPGDILLHREEDGTLSLLTVERNDGEKLRCQGKEGESLTLPVGDPALEGRVTGELPVLGNLLAGVLRAENRTTVYLCVGIGLVFGAAALVLLYCLSAKLGGTFADTREDREALAQMLAPHEDGEDTSKDESADSTSRTVSDQEAAERETADRPASDRKPVEHTPFPQLARVKRLSGGPARAGETDSDSPEESVKIYTLHSRVDAPSRKETAKAPQEPSGAGRPSPAPEEGHSAGRPSPAPEEGRSSGRPLPAPEEGHSAGRPLPAPEEGHSARRPSPAPEEEPAHPSTLSASEAEDLDKILREIERQFKDLG